MGSPCWPNGSPIEGVTVLAAKDGDPPTFELDFALELPANEDEWADAVLLSTIHNAYGFLPDDPSRVRHSDLKEIDACFAFAEEFLTIYEHDETLKHDLTLALGCVCFRDEILRTCAIFMSVDDPTATDRFGAALEAIIHEAFPT